MLGSRRLLGRFLFRLLDDDVRHLDRVWAAHLQRLDLRARKWVLLDRHRDFGVCPDDHTSEVVSPRGVGPGLVIEVPRIFELWTAGELQLHAPPGNWLT